MSKIDVNGDNTVPIDLWLTQKALNGKLNAPIQWDFQKVIKEELGGIVDLVLPKEDPLCDKIVKWKNQKRSKVAMSILKSKLNSP